MKAKILLTILIAISLSSTSYAQIDKGNTFLGGNISLYNHNYNDNSEPENSYKYGVYGANIQVGTVVMDNTIAGIMLSYNNSNYRNNILPDSNYTKINTYGFGVFYRKYKKILKNFYFVGEGNVFYSYTKGNEASSANQVAYSNFHTNSIGVAFIPGLSYSLSKRFAMELLMNNLLTVTYSHSKTDENLQSGNTPSSATIKQNTFNASANLNSNFLSNFGIGFKFFLSNGSNKKATRS